jgi:glycosyltransferase involved in cell wall biosynthesis
MNILLMTNELSRNNGWATVGFYVNRFLRQRHKVEVMSLEGLKPTAHYNPITRWRAANKILATIDDIDLIVCNVEPLLPLASVLARRLSARLLLICQGTYAYFPFVRGIRGVINRRFARQIDSIIVPSAFTRDKVATWWPHRIKVVPYGVDTDHYHPVAARKEEAFIFVGAQKSRKGVEVLMQAFERLLLDFPGVKLNMVGKPQDSLRAIADKKGGKNIVFHGQVGHERLLQLYSSSICHVLPSKNTATAFEGFGLVHLEANACGIPSIGSIGTANESVIKPGTNGFLIDPDNADQLYRTMRMLITDRQMAEQLGASSLDHARQNSWESNLEGLQDVIDAMR